MFVTCLSEINIEIYTIKYYDELYGIFVKLYPCVRDYIFAIVTLYHNTYNILAFNIGGAKRNIHFVERFQFNYMHRLSQQICCIPNHLN